MLGPGQIGALAEGLRASFEIDSIRIGHQESEASPFRYRLVIGDDLIFSFESDLEGWTCSNTWVQAFFSTINERLEKIDLDSQLFLEGGLLWWSHSVSQSSSLFELQQEISDTSPAIVEGWIGMYLAAKKDDSDKAVSLEALLSTWVEISEVYGFRESEVLKLIQDELGFDREEVVPETSESFSLEAYEADNALSSLPVESGDGHEISRSRDLDSWLRSRRDGVTATDARRLIRRDGKLSKQRIALLRQKLDESFVPYSSNEMAYGIEREEQIAKWVSLNFPGAKSNDVLFERHSGHLATPDMIHPEFVVEIKSSTKALEEILRTYKDQFQWQMHVLDRPRALVVVEHPETKEIRTFWVEADTARISRLVEVADCFLEALDTARIEGKSAESVLAESDSRHFAPPSSTPRKGLLARVLERGRDDRPVEVRQNPSEKLDLSGLNEDLVRNVEVPSAGGESNNQGNPIRVVRELCRMSQAEFGKEFGFAKATLISLESGMFASVSERQEAAVKELAGRNYFDLATYLLKEHDASDLNSAYRRWQRISRRANFAKYLAKERPPFPFSRSESPLETMMKDTAGSVDAFCKAFKFQRISIMRYLAGETRILPRQFRDALTDAGFQYLEQLETSQIEWSFRFVN